MYGYTFGLPLAKPLTLIVLWAQNEPESETDQAYHI